MYIAYYLRYRTGLFTIIQDGILNCDLSTAHLTRTTDDVTDDMAASLTTFETNEAREKTHETVLCGACSTQTKRLVFMLALALVGRGLIFADDHLDWGLRLVGCNLRGRDSHF